MSNGKATVSFFENGSTTQFEYCYKMYPQVLKLKAEKRCKKPQELIRLDHWYQNDLPGLIKARGKDAHLLYDELVQTMKWKQSRGKFYPQLSYLVKVNTPRAVVQETKKAFRKLPNLEQAITALSNLKGVGTTMASALLAAAAPHLAPFMADECLMAIPEIEGIDYTTKEYLNFVQHIQATVERLNAEVGGDTPHWSSHRVELALWAHYVANDLSPELLDDMPPPGTGVNSNAGAAISTNGSNNKISDGDDTNDGVAVDLDDESLGAGGRHTAAESETDNENTNPAPLLPNINNSGVAKMNNTSASTAVGAALQDGDSNFVSNDSTSQEPIIDDNDGTTQTTATTTSTEDGEPTAIGIGGTDGTPLASDSESNLEAPLKSNNRLQSQQTAAAAAAAVATHNNNSSSKQQPPQVINNGQAAAATAAAPVSTPAAAAASLTTPAQAPKSAAAANGNGNGVLGNDVDDEDDDEDDEEDEDDDEELDEEDEDNDDELEADESNSSSGILRDSSKLQQLQSTAAAEAAGGETAPAIGQKRAALHCDGGAIGGSDGSVGSGGGGDTKSPDLKKLRSE